MKTKTIIATILVVCLTALSGITSLAQTVTVNNVPAQGIYYPVITWVQGVFPRITWRLYQPQLIDGAQTRISWSADQNIGPNNPLVVSEVVLAQVGNDGVETDLGLITFGSDNPSSSKLNWMARSVNNTSGQYRIIVRWYDLSGNFLGQAGSYKFQIKLYGTERAIVMTEPANTDPSFTRGQYDSFWVRWNSQGTIPLPADARVAVIAKPYNDWQTAIVIAEPSDTGAVLVRGGALAPGKYFVGVTYAMPHGIMVATSNEAIVEILE